VDADRNHLRLCRLSGRRSSREYNVPGFPRQGKCQKAAAAMNTSERVDIGGARAGRPSISPPAYYQIVARCVER
jgi:hypothetical protein